jgi:hypothetical protein
MKRIYVQVKTTIQEAFVEDGVEWVGAPEVEGVLIVAEREERNG